MDYNNGINSSHFTNILGPTEKFFFSFKSGEFFFCWYKKFNFNIFNFRSFREGSASWSEMIDLAQLGRTRITVSFPVFVLS